MTMTAPARSQSLHRAMRSDKASDLIVVTSPPHLHTLCQAASAVWLLEWTRRLSRLRQNTATCKPEISKECFISPSMNEVTSDQCYQEPSLFNINSSSSSNVTARSHVPNSVKKGEKRSKRNSLKLSYDSLVPGSPAQMVNILNSASQTIDTYSPTSSHIQQLLDDSTCDHNYLTENIRLLEAISRKIHNTSSGKTVLGQLENKVDPQQSLMKSRRRLLRSSRLLTKTEAAEAIRHCANYITSSLPPVMIHCVLALAWQRLSQEVQRVDPGSISEAVPTHQALEWAQQVPVFLYLVSLLSGSKKFSLDMTGIQEKDLEEAFNLISEQSAFNHVGKLILPYKRNSGKSKISIEESRCSPLLLSFIRSTLLTSLTLRSNLCTDEALNLIGKLSLHELDIGGSNEVSEGGVLKGLCGLPLLSGSEIMQALEGGVTFNSTSSNLRRSLSRLRIAFHNLPDVVYQVLLIVFPELHQYNPYRNLVNSIHCFNRLPKTGKESKNISDVIVHKHLKLTSLELFRVGSGDIMIISRVCPHLQDITLSVDADAIGILESLKALSGIRSLTLTYYPADFSAAPKMSSSFLLSIVHFFKDQLESLSLTGYNLKSDFVSVLATLPSLTSLRLDDCWVSVPTTTPSNAFKSLQSLQLTFLPSAAFLTLMTACETLESLSLDLVASQYEGNSLTDTCIKKLVRSGLLKSLTNFRAQSPHLSMASFHALSALPNLTSIGVLDLWGLTEDERQCAAHSESAHILCH